MRFRVALFGVVASGLLIASAAHGASATRLQIDSARLGVWVDVEGGGLGGSTGGGGVAGYLTSGDQPVVGRSITFATDEGKVICIAITVSDGRGACPKTAIVAALPFNEFTATFGGDVDFDGASDRATLGTFFFGSAADPSCWFADPDTGLAGCNL